MSDLQPLPEDTPSGSASNRSSSSISRRVTSLLGGRSARRSASSQSLPGSGLRWEPLPDDEEEGRDPLPTNKEELEGRLNFHLGELDRLRRYVELMNNIKLEQESHMIQVASRAKGAYIYLQCLMVLFGGRNTDGCPLYQIWQCQSRSWRSWSSTRLSHAKSMAYTSDTIAGKSNASRTSGSDYKRATSKCQHFPKWSGTSPMITSGSRCS